MEYNLKNMMIHLWNSIPPICMADYMLEKFNVDIIKKRVDALRHYIVSKNVYENLLSVSPRPWGVS